ncbi:MAG: DoxX family protein [Ferruginibacter sp.]
MTYLQQLHQWSAKHHQRWFVVLRIILGLSLIVKGIQFIRNTAMIEQLLHHSVFSGQFQWLGTFIPWLHLFGGTMLLAGLFTRISVLFQIPIVAGAVFFINTQTAFLPGLDDTLFSIVVLLLLLFFLLEGGGPYSLDNALRHSKNRS